MTRIETLSYIVQPPIILLGYKRPKKKFGGRWNGFGGGVEEGETIRQTDKREVMDETGIKLIRPVERGIILFKFVDDPNEYDHEVHIFTAENYSGILKPTEDFLCYAWFHKDALPDPMMPADKKYVIPPIFNGDYFNGEIHFNKNWEVVFAEVNPVKRLE
jgi:8-oxo-dGTP pyrophosphatase MutT (NUDIX family)